MTGGAAPKRKGSRFERDVVAFLAAHGFPDAERAYGAGRIDDVGDISGVPDFTIQCRNTKTLELAAALNDAERQRARARSPYSVVVHKRRNRPTCDSYVTMTLAQFCALTGGFTNGD